MVMIMMVLLLLLLLVSEALFQMCTHLQSSPLTNRSELSDKLENIVFLNCVFLIVSLFVSIALAESGCVAKSNDL